MKVVSALIFAAGLIGASADVVTGTASNFPEIVSKSSVTLVKFYAPWCGHCKRLAPEFETAAADLKGTATLMDVDCTQDENKELCGEFQVQGYPTLKIFRGDVRSPEDYQGPREAAGIISYMRKQNSEPHSILHTVKEIELFKTNTDTGLLVYAEMDSPAYKAVTETAKTFRNDYDFGIVTDKDFFGDAATPRATFYKTFDVTEMEYSGEFSRASLEAFLTLEAFPMLGEIGPENYGKYIDRGLPLVWFFYGDDEESTTSLETATAVAGDFKGRLSFVKLDGGRWQQHAKSMGVDRLPGVCIQQGKKNFVLEGEVSAETVKSHCNGMLDGSILPKLKSQEIPEDNDGPVTVVVGKNFEEVVYDESKDVFVKFYAPWCGHCKSLAPKYDALGERFVGAEHIIIAKVDATENDIPADISGFPTLIYYPGGDKDGIVYNGDRSEEAMAEFIENKAVSSVKAAIKDEL